MNGSNESSVTGRLAYRIEACGEKTVILSESTKFPPVKIALGTSVNPTSTVVDVSTYGARGGSGEFSLHFVRL